jgi:hypothetical protein
MSEAEKREAALDDVLEDTFIRFCQFAYTGDYETPAFVHTPLGAESTASSSVSGDETAEEL